MKLKVFAGILTFVFTILLVIVLQQKLYSEVEKAEKYASIELDRLLESEPTAAAPDFEDDIPTVEKIDEEIRLIFKED